MQSEGQNPTEDLQNMAQPSPWLCWPLCPLTHGEAQGQVCPLQSGWISWHPKENISVILIPPLGFSSDTLTHESYGLATKKIIYEHFDFIS